MLQFFHIATFARKYADYAMNSFFEFLKRYFVAKTLNQFKSNFLETGWVNFNKWHVRYLIKYYVTLVNKGQMMLV